MTNVTYAVSPAVTLKYDALNRLTNMVDGVGTTAYEHAFRECLYLDANRQFHLASSYH